MVWQPWLGPVEEMNIAESCNQTFGISPEEITDVFNETLGIPLCIERPQTIIPGMSIETWGYLLAIGAALPGSIDSAVINNKLVKHDLFVICFWTSGFGAFSSLVLTLSFEDCRCMLLSYSPMDTCFIAGNAVCAALYSILSMYAIQKITTTEVAMVGTLKIVFLVIAQYTILSGIHSGHKNILEVTGASLIVLGTSCTSFYTFCCLKDPVDDLEKNNNDDKK